MAATDDPAAPGSTEDASSAGRLVWIDMEMTGLNVNVDHILEVACIITDKDLNIVAEGPNLVVHQSDHILSSMGPWCIEQHGRSGLTQAVRASMITVADADRQLARFVSSHVPHGACPLAGNSVHMDKRFIDKYLPALASQLHYRIVDVSTVKELCRRWYPDVIESAPHKAANHRALEDIRDSIRELQHYKQFAFRE